MSRGDKGAKTGPAGTKWRETLTSSHSSSSSHNNSHNSSSNDSSGSSDGYESDWERNVTEDGDVFYLVPLQNQNGSMDKIDPDKAPKASEKLARMIRRRESKRERNAPALPVKASVSHIESSDNESSTYYGQLKTFESVFEGVNPVEMSEVVLRIKGKKHVTPGRSLLEQMMGVIPVRRAGADSQHLTSVIVSGFLTDGPAIKISDKLQVGDIIRLVDGQQVNLATMEQLLSTYTNSTKVKLTIQRPSKLLSPQETSSSHDESSGSSAKEFMSETKLSSVLRRHPFLVQYLTRSGLTESSPDMADVVFQFPSGSVGSQTAKLIKTRGILVTLTEVLAEVTGATPAHVSILVDSTLVHIGVASEREDTLIVIVPHAKASAKEVANFVRNLVRLIKVRYKNLSTAFRKHQSALQELFTNFALETIFSSLMTTNAGQSVPNLELLPELPEKSSSRFESLLPYCQWLNLPDEIRFQIDDAISQFESADFQDFSEEFYDLPREFHILGSCLFHKGSLLSSHLAKDDLIDVFLWCQNKCILGGRNNCTPVHQLVSWTEIHLTRLQRHDVAERTFLLVVGAGYQVLATILQTGECTANDVGVRDTLRPDPFYVDQAMNTLDHLEEMGIPVVCERWLTLPSNPDILDVDNLFEGAIESNKKELDTSVLSKKMSSKSLPDQAIVLKRTKTVEYTSSSASTASESERAGSSAGASAVVNPDACDTHDSSGEEMQTAFRGEESKDPDSSRTDDETSLWELHRSGQRRRTNYSQEAAQGSISDSNSEEYVTYNLAQLTISPENTLFHFIHLDVADAIYLAPLSPPTPGHHLHAGLLESFRSACQVIHQTFQTSLRGRDAFRVASKSKSWTNRSLVAVKEQGMLCHWSPRAQPEASKALPLLSYWICGRLFVAPNPRECYVCFHESAPQNMIELAFRLAHGIQM